MGVDVRARVHGSHGGHFGGQVRIEGVEEKIENKERSYPASVRPAEVSVELGQMRKKVIMLQEELVKLRKYKIFVLTKELQRLLSELDSTPRDHKDREWMQQRVLALQQKEAALQQKEAALQQQEAALQQQKAALQQKEAALVQKELHELQQRENKLCKGTTLYTPRGRDGYRQRDLKLTTRKQLAAKLCAIGDNLVAVVESMPQQLLGPEYEDAQDVDVVELADGMQLAVVVDAERTPLGKLAERVSDVENMATEHAGWQRGRIRADETRSREWAVQHLIQTGHKGVRPFCCKKITLKQDGKTEGQVEIDGMAVSDTAVVLVERKPIINMKYVNGLLFKLRNYEYIVDNNAPNTEQLVTTATVLSPRTRKPVQAVLMADGWVDNESERAACKQVMLQAGILPVLPCAASHAQGDSCNSWPPQAEDLALAAQYSSTQPKQARGVVTNATVSLQHTKRSVAKAQRGLQARYPGPPPGRPSATSFDGEGPPPARGYCYHCGLSSHWTKHCKRKASGLSKEAAMKDAGTWELMQDLKKGGSAPSKAVKQDRSPDRDCAVHMSALRPCQTQVFGRKRQQACHSLSGPLSLSRELVEFVVALPHGAPLPASKATRLQARQDVLHSLDVRARAVHHLTNFWMAEMIRVTVVNEDGESIRAQPVVLNPDPPISCQAVITLLQAGGVGQGFLLQEGVTLRLDDWVTAGNYTYCLTVAAPARAAAGGLDVWADAWSTHPWHAFATAENKLYNSITLYTLRGRDGYRQRDLKLTTRKQLAAKLSAIGDNLVAVVESMPQQLLGPEYEDAQDVDVVELADGMQLAVVVDAERTPLGKLAERVSDVEDMATEHAGWQRGRIRTDETRSREWAVQHLIQTGHKGVRPFCYKKITLKQDGKTEGQVEIDGMAVSETAVVLVERKPIINMKHVNGLLFKLRNYEYIVDNNAPNTEQLATTPTVLSPRTRKPVQAVLMADGWVDNESERAACKQVMLQAGILPVLPCAASHAQGDSCNSWPPQAEDLALAAQYSSTQPKQARGVVTNATVSLQHTKRSVCNPVSTGSRPPGIRHVSQPRWVAVRSTGVFR
ncbi:hypothetical protein QJQ45_019396 [Haematococcus lacustris]|nr:hypothetical protein QJQ45_019396 [Haematococcus lacustris]